MQQLEGGIMAGFFIMAGKIWRFPPENHQIYSTVIIPCNVYAHSLFITHKKDFSFFWLRWKYSEITLYTILTFRIVVWRCGPVTEFWEKVTFERILPFPFIFFLFINVLNNFLLFLKILLFSWYFGISRAKVGRALQSGLRILGVTSCQNFVVNRSLCV